MKIVFKRINRGLLLIIIMFLLIVSGALGFRLHQLQANLTDKSVATNDSATHPFLASRIFVDNPNDTIINFAPLRQDLREYFSKLDINYSFYAEYLPTGTSIKINQDNPMVGASLLKLPLVMNLFYGAEHGQIALSTKVTMQEGDVDKRSGTLWQKGVGSQFTVEELARQAIVQSDNTAVNMLIGATSGKFDLFQKTINELDVDLIAENSTQTVLGAGGYSSMLKCLYLSCVNTYADSQQILTWMTESNSPPRLRAGVPSNVRVAHKYGTSGGTSESDCGIVYAPKRPYIICVMLGTPDDNANKIIQDISKKVYDYISTAQ